jgi:hypothetical protein
MHRDLSEETEKSHQNLSHDNRVPAGIRTEDLSHTILERYRYISLLGIWLVISVVDLCQFL